MEQGKSQMTKASFDYGKVVSLKLPYADCPTTRDFYCIDQATAEIVRLLAEQSMLPDWGRSKGNRWYRMEPKDSLWISKTPRGWLAVRWSRTEKVLTHLDYVMPLLFPSPEMAMSAAELCYPRPHPALCWTGGVPACMVETYQGACGYIGWERSLRHGVWADFAITWAGKQVTSMDEPEDALTTTLRDWTDPTGVVH